MHPWPKYLGWDVSRMFTCRWDAQSIVLKMHKTASPTPDQWNFSQSFCESVSWLYNPQFDLNKLSFFEISFGCIGLSIWCSRCCGLGSIPGRGIFYMSWARQKKNKFFFFPSWLDCSLNFHGPSGETLKKWIPLFFIKWCCVPSRRTCTQ